MIARLRHKLERRVRGLKASAHHRWLAATDPDQARVVAMVEALQPWFHNLHLPHGIQTHPDHPFGDFPARKWSQLRPHLPERLDGWHVLDIGCNAGFYSFEMARLGATVTAIDVDAHYLTQARWAARVLGLDTQIEFRQMQIYELAQEEQAYDLMLFMGVFYHLRYPLLAVDILSQKVRRLLVFQSLQIPGEEVEEDTHDKGFGDRELFHRRGWPKMAFIEHRFSGDPTNWWAPNRAAVHALFRSTGLRLREDLGHEMYLFEPDPLSGLNGDCWNRDEYLAATGQLRHGLEGE